MKITTFLVSNNHIKKLHKGVRKKKTATESLSKQFIKKFSKVILSFTVCRVTITDLKTINREKHKQREHKNTKWQRQ